MADKKNCPECGAPNAIISVYCKRCGYDFNRIAKPTDEFIREIQNPAIMVKPSRPPMMAALVTVGLVCVGLVAVGIVVYSVMNYLAKKDYALDTEVKANLHEIQLALERYSTDMEGAVPIYLIGGEPAYTLTIGERTGAPEGSTPITQYWLVSDPLIREGYLTAYPRNPFVVDGIHIHKIQQDRLAPGTASDPLRNGPSGVNRSNYQVGTRFGAHCNHMGSVLGDMRYQLYTYYLYRGKTGEVFSRPSYANTVYKFWDVEFDDNIQEYMPGSLFYKSHVSLMLPDGKDPNDMHLPGIVTRYVMGVYGQHHKRGKDLIGEEMPFIRDGENYWDWTRSDDRSKLGSPFRIVQSGDGYDAADGNPNGIGDGVILMLSNAPEEPEGH